jgi:hypothetical protein
MGQMNVKEFVDVVEKAKELDCEVPIGIALLPRNFDTAASKGELIHESSAPTVRVLWRQAGITETPLEGKSESFLQISEHGLADWIGPTILVSAGWLSQNPEVMAVALGVIPTI